MITKNDSEKRQQNTTTKNDNEIPQQKTTTENDNWKW